MIQPTENTDTEHNNGRPIKSTANKVVSKKGNMQANTKPEKIEHDEIRTDQLETRQAIFLLEHYDINHIEILMSSVTKLALL